jgi:hypothetical protein
MMIVAERTFGLPGTARPKSGRYRLGETPTYLLGKCMGARDW